MPLWLLTAWPILKKVGPWLALALALLLGWHAVAVHYREQGRDESAARIVSDEASMKRGIEAIAALRGALDDQNARVRSLAAEGQKRAQEAVQGRDAAVKANRSLVDAQTKLAAVAKRSYIAGDPCTTPAEVMGMKL